MLFLPHLSCLCIRYVNTLPLDYHTEWVHYVQRWITFIICLVNKMLYINSIFRNCYCQHTASCKIRTMKCPYKNTIYLNSKIVLHQLMWKPCICIGKMHSIITHHERKLKSTVSWHFLMIDGDKKELIYLIQV